MRRPAAPHLHPGRPGTPARVAPTPAPAPAPPENTPAATAAEAGTATAPSSADAAGAPAPRRASPPRTGRRAVLLVGAAAAVGGAVGTGALLRTGGPAAPSAASSEGTAPGGGSTTAHFADVAADDPGAAAMRWADETGVQPALTAAGYSPQAAVNRGDVSVALHRLAGAPAVDLESTPVLLTDLGEDPVRVTAMLWLHGRGALWGDAQLRARPEETATRDCTAAMLTALLRPALAGMGITWDASVDAALPQAEDPGSALPDIAWLEAAGIAPSTSADRDGDAAVTRADLAVSLHRAHTVIAAALD